MRQLSAVLVKKNEGVFSRFGNQAFTYFSLSSINLLSSKSTKER